MSQPILVIAGDIHYSLPNLILADKSTRMAITKANELGVPFLANGDTHDQKANLRGECVNALIETFKTAKIKPYLNIGNHCKISSKGIEHSLNFLAPYAHVIDKYEYIPALNSHIVAYHDDLNELREVLSQIPADSRVILHQGLNGSNMGEYVIDKSALDPIDLKDFRSILSHYHAYQNITCGPLRTNQVGLATFVGSPYSQTYGEADDPEKGFRILNDDGTLDFVPTNLRKHVIYGLKCDSMGAIYSDQMFCSSDVVDEQDLKWVKIIGEKSGINRIRREAIEFILKIKDFRLDLNPLDTESKPSEVKTLTQHELLDSIIDNTTNTSDEAKTRVKQLWRNLCK